jgi:small subunit ribosomal protein S1
MSIKKRFAPEIFSDFSSSEDFASLYQLKADVVREGSVVQGTVVGIEKEVVIVDVGLKNEGRIPVTEFSLAPDLPLPEIGELVKVYVEKIEGYNGRTILSREKAIREESWEHLESALQEGRTVDGVIFGRVKGGFTVDLSGVVAFLPGSQVDVRPIKDVAPIMDIVQPFQILKMDKKLGNIVVSRRAIMEESRMEARNEMLETIEEGMQMKGVVKNIVNYGAFIDLGKVDGLLHVTDISWSRINHPSEVLAIGQEIDVVVIKFNEETKRISLGMKQLESNPWRGISEQFPVDKALSGKISNIADYGAFIELKPGIEGLVHTSEISWTKTTQHPKKLLSIGQEVKFVILEVDEDKHRISLSIKKCISNPWQNFADNHKVGDVIKGQIRNVADFGMFVALDEDIDGLVHASDIGWSGSGEAELKNYKKGQEIECKVLAMDVSKERISLGIKQLNDDPYAAAFDGYEKGATVSCVVASTNKDGVEVNVDDKFITTIKRSDLSSDKEDQRTDRFSIGDKVDAKIISFDKMSRKITLSIKALELDERKKAMQEHSGDAGSSIGDILGEALNQAKADK